MSFTLSAIKSIGESLKALWESTGFVTNVYPEGYHLGIWGLFIMMGIACLLIYLAIVKKFEPNLLLSIALVCFGKYPGAYNILLRPRGWRNRRRTAVVSL